MHKIGQLGGFLGRHLQPLLKTGLSLMKNILKSGNVLIPLGITAAAAATDVAIRKKVFGSGMTTLRISNEEMNDIIKIVKSLEKFGLLIKSVSETNRNSKRTKRGISGYGIRYISC